MIVWKFLMITSISLGIAALYRVPRSYIPWCGLIGGIAGMIMIGLQGFMGQGFATFFAAFAVGIISEVMARKKKVPVSVFLVPGFIPLVPGRFAYLTMRYFVELDLISGLGMLVHTLFIAGAIAFGLFFSGTLYRILSKNWRHHEAG